MNAHVNAISNRLSLRPPQRESLEILDRVCSLIPLKKDVEVQRALEAITEEFPTVTDFERDFPSLCFALATGVGKTRLMGAFISYLYLAKGIRHFFVLAPSLTVYDKLIQDFTPNTPKYVFQGIGAFATHAPLIITGDNYEDGRGTRGYLLDMGQVHINIFNISKINSEVRGGKAPRIKRLSEYIGQSYFDYLAGLDDLVMLMDESHRYRASAGIRAINELHPILGLELTATPQVEQGQRAIPFNNVIYSYPLRNAMEDGFVKEPAVATRENFDPANYDKAGLERLKLEDGVRIHETTKTELEVYARNNAKPVVKPFILIIAQDTDHANELVKTIEDDSFFHGRYKGKAITVHSNLRGEVKDEVVQQLLTVEDPENPTEIVVHVNMLKEGWDVTNLYTIIPLRAANSKTLVEQSIGRGLRLPYGKRVGVPAVDRLTIVSHDRFQEIIDEAERPDSIIRAGVIIGRDIPEDGKKLITTQPGFTEKLLGGTSEPGATYAGLFERPEEQRAVKATLEVLQDFERLPRAVDLQNSEIKAEILERVATLVGPVETLGGVVEAANLPKLIEKTTDTYIEMSIDIPRIIVVPQGEVTCRYIDFDLDTSAIPHLQLVAKDILIQHLHDHERYRLVDGSGIIEERRLEDYLVRGLIDFSDISYDDHAELLYKLAGQMVEHLRSYLKDDNEVVNVLQFHQQVLVNLIHAQMQDHYEESVVGYETRASKGFHTLRPSVCSIDTGENIRPFRVPVEDRQRIRSMAFGGFRKCLYRVQKFDSDPERRFAVVVEDDDDAIKWFRPGRDDIGIDYSREEHSYEPDFVVEANTRKFLCEVKQTSEMQDPVVLTKANAAATWCAYASEHSDKPWTYLLIPDNKIGSSNTLAGLAAAWTYSRREE